MQAALIREPVLILPILKKQENAKPDLPVLPIVHKSDSWSGRALPSPGKGKVVEGEGTRGQVLKGEGKVRGGRAPN